MSTHNSNLSSANPARSGQRVAKYETERFGFKQIVEFHGRRQAEDIESAYAGERDRYQTARDAYFTTPVDIFPLDAAQGNKKVYFHSIKWPRYLEDYLKEIVDSKFPGFDDDIRRLIDELGKVYAGNLSRLVILKRVFLLLSLLIFVGLAYLLLPSEYLPGARNLLSHLDWKAEAGEYAAVALAVAALFAGIFFYGLNQRLFEKYSEALRVSCHTVSLAIQARMSELSDNYTALRAKSRDDEHEPDWPDRAALWTEMLLWTAKRSEYIEVYLLYEMQRSRRFHTVRHRWGLAATIVVALIFLGVAGCDYALVGADRDWPGLAIPLALAAMTLATCFVSYFNSKWNSGDDIVQRKLTTSDWKTYAKLRLHERLGEQTRFDKKTIIEYKNSHRGGGGGTSQPPPRDDRGRSEH